MTLYLSSAPSALELDLDTLSYALYETREPLAPPPRTTLLRVPWPIRSEPVPSPNHSPLAIIRRGLDSLPRRGSVDIYYDATAVDRLMETGMQDEDPDEEDEGGEEHRDQELQDPRPLPPKETQSVEGETFHRNFDSAPYPCSSDEDMLDITALNCDIQCRIKGSVTYHVFEPGKQPRKCLDLGCGIGDWVLAAAEEWPECVFVGLDIADIQPDLNHRPDLNKRITWVHANFLQKRLPFDDEMFDHVRIMDISKGMPENEWMFLFEEVTRIMQPGATFEMIEEDIIFPNLTHLPPSDAPSATPSLDAIPPLTSNEDASSGTLSSSSELPLLRSERRQSFNVHPSLSSDDSLSKTAPIPIVIDLLGLPDEHDHSLLEKLFYAVFETRQINCEATGYIPLCLDTFMKRSMIAPPLVFPAQPFLGTTTGSRETARFPYYDAAKVSLHSNALHALSDDKFLPNEQIRPMEALTSLHIYGIAAYQAVLSAREAMWEEYQRMAKKEREQRERWSKERVEIERRRERREQEAKEGWTPSDIARSPVEGSAAPQIDLHEHHARLIAMEETRDATRLAELDRLERAVSEKERKRKRARGEEADEILVDRVQVAPGASGAEQHDQPWTDVTVAVSEEKGFARRHERRKFDILMERYERDMKYRTQHAHISGQYLGQPVPEMPPSTAEEVEWRHGFEEMMSRGDDKDVVWRKMRVYCAWKG